VSEVNPWFAMYVTNAVMAAEDIGEPEGVMSDLV
jgi:hypothetical protein